MAQTFQRLGSEVSIFEMTDHILPREDEDAAAIVQQAFVRDGVKLLLSARVVRVEAAGGRKRIVYSIGGEERTLEVDEILVGIGRAPNVQGLGLEQAGVRYDDRRGVEVDDRLRTSNPRIFAAGDICMPTKFTHMADAAAKIVVRNALFFGRQKLSAVIVPWCTYTEPEIAHVGMYARDAEAAGIAIDTYLSPLAGNDRSRAEGDTSGFVKVHAKKGTGTILGATIVAKHAGEMISEVTVAMAGKVGLATLSGIVHPYPTQAEAIKATTGEYMRGRLTPRVAKLFEAWLRISR
jgi:pyruvate/2-oxoglutarate dehydrogenase complex dihydrolipoamide dehydrogenase (E3) component